MRYITAQQAEQIINEFQASICAYSERTRGSQPGLFARQRADQLIDDVKRVCQGSNVSWVFDVTHWNLLEGPQHGKVADVIKNWLQRSATPYTFAVLDKCREAIRDGTYEPAKTIESCIPSGKQELLIYRTSLGYWFYCMKARWLTLSAGVKKITFGLVAGAATALTFAKLGPSYGLSPREVFGGSFVTFFSAATLAFAIISFAARRGRP